LGGIDLEKNDDTIEFNDEEEAWYRYEQMGVCTLEVIHIATRSLLALVNILGKENKNERYASQGAAL